MEGIRNRRAVEWISLVSRKSATARTRMSPERPTALVTGPCPNSEAPAPTRAQPEESSTLGHQPGAHHPSSIVRDEGECVPSSPAATSPNVWTRLGAPCKSEGPAHGVCIGCDMPERQMVIFMNALRRGLEINTHYRVRGWRKQNHRWTELRASANARLRPARRAAMLGGFIV